MTDQTYGPEEHKEVGLKFDDNKLRWDLLPIKELEQVVEVITHGCQKYGPNNWKSVKPFNDRYFAALMRHLVAWRGGENIDPDSKLHHLSHAACNILFLLWGNARGRQDGIKI